MEGRTVIIQMPPPATPDRRLQNRDPGQQMASRRRRMHILSRAGERTDCTYCGQHTNLRFGLTLIHDWHLATVDHLLQRAVGGDHSIENIRLACMWRNVVRSMAGHCIAAFRYAETVVGSGGHGGGHGWTRGTPDRGLRWGLTVKEAENG
jgi:hypothetical protein